MKKRPVVLFAALAVLLVCGAAFAEEKPLSIEAEQNGNTVTVEITIPENTGTCIMQFGLDYDPKELTITNAAPGGILQGTLAPLVNRTEEGSVYFVWDSLDPLTAGGSVLTLTFEAKKEVVLDSIVSFKTDYDFILQDGNYQDVAVEPGASEPESTPGVGETPAPEVSEAPEPDTELSESGEGEAPKPTAEPTPRPAAIVFETTEAKIEAGSELQLSPKLEGTDTTKEPPTYYSSDESVATVDENGNVTAKGPGTATITAITTDGTASGEMTVTVAGETTIETVGGSEKAGMPDEAKWLLIAAAVLILIAGGAFLFLKKKA